MDACCARCVGYDDEFGPRVAQRELRVYRGQGPGGTARILRDLVVQAGVQGATLLDVGGGVGALQHELVAAGVQSVVDVDASRAYLDAAREEATRRGYADRARYVHADFAVASRDVDPADIVTLDRVLCCYADWPALVASSTAKARRLYAFAIPRDRWSVRLVIGLGNLVRRMRRSRFRAYVHPPHEVEALVGRAGFAKRGEGRTWVWRALVYERVPDADGAPGAAAAGAATGAAWEMASTASSK